MTTPAIQGANIDPAVKAVLEAMPSAATVAANLATLKASVIVDLGAHRTAITAITAKMDVLAGKLNADAGVTDTNYAVNFASTIDPAANTTV